MFSENKRTRIVALFLFVVMLIGMLPIQSFAASYTTGTYLITAKSGLNVRSGPGTGFKTVTAIPYNKTVEVTKVSGSWGLVTYNSKSGWISMQYTKKLVTEKSVNYQVQITANTGLNVRSGAGNGYSVVTSIPKNKIVTITKESNGWGYTKYNGKSGWILLTYTKKHISNSPNNSSNNSRNNTSFNIAWPCEKAFYISTLYYYWNGGSPYKHGTRSNYRNAIDITGGGNILSVESGKVVSAGWNNSGFGYCVVIEHSNGLRSLYGHLSSYSVKAGQTVSKGQKIGVMGTTGRSSGVHLHFELYDPNNYNKVIDPWANYYQKQSTICKKITIGGNSRKANKYFSNKGDSASKNWVYFLDSKCKLNSSGDYIYK